MNNIQHWPFSFLDSVNESRDNPDMDKALSHLSLLQDIEWFKNRVNLSIDEEYSDDFWTNHIELKEVNTLIDWIYENYLNNFSLIFPNWIKWDTVLFKIPSEHASGFLPMLIEKSNDPQSDLSKYNIDWVIMDSPTLNDFWEDNDFLKYSYDHLIKKAKAADKYIDIMDYQWAQKDFVNSDDAKNFFIEIDKNYQNQMRKLKARKPFGKTYFPSQQQADLAWISFKELCKVFKEAGNLDWLRMNDANEELAEHFREYNSVKVKWDNVDIEFDITWKWAMNSVIATNFPWSEVFTAPTLNGVNWWIVYENQVRIKEIWETIKWLKFEFKNWRLEKFEIVDNRYTTDKKNELISKLEKLFFAKEENRHLWELAFWTNFHVVPGFLHSLIWEKALWMHIALWEVYTDPIDDGWKNQHVDNWNHWADYHIDLIRKMDDWSVVTFGKKNWKTIEIMNNWVFDKDSLPKLNEYQLEIRDEKNKK